MNKTKRALQLTGAIISIVLGGFLLLGAIIVVAYTPALLAMLGVTYTAEMLSEIYVACGLYVLFAIALIIVAAFLCPNPAKKSKPTEYKGLTITLLVLNAVLLASVCSSISNAASILAIICCLVNIGFFITVLCIPSELQNATQNAQSENKQNIQQQNTNSTEQNDILSSDKIKQIRELNRQGVITDSEMKELIIKELNK